MDSQIYRAPLTEATISGVQPRRRVLIVEDDASIQNVLYVLLGGLNYDCEVALSGEQALEMIEREDFDAVLLDLCYSNLSLDQIASRIIEIRPSLRGRILVATKQAEDPHTLEFAPLGFPNLNQNRMMEDVHRNLCALWGHS